MINTKRPNTNDYTQVGFIEAKDNQSNYQNIDHIYDSEGNIVFQQGYLNEYDGADDFDISAIGKPLIDYTIYGNTEQIGIPEPNEPIYPEGCGEQTNNLVPPLSEWVDGFIQIDGTLEEQTENFEKTSGMIPVKPNIKYTFAHESGSFPDGENGPRSVIAQYDNTGKYINQEAWTYKNPYPYTPSDNVGYVRLYFNTYNQPGNIMFNMGPEALPYEPYGYKIPIMAGKYEFLEEPLRAVKNYKDTIDLSTKLLSRQIKELVLTGEETVYKYEYSGTIGFSVNNVLDANYNRTRGMCTHYTVVTGAYKNSLWIGVNNKNLYFIGIGDFLGITEVADFKAYLTQQYAAGTPVTIWYALAESVVTTLSSIPDGLRGIIEGKGSQLSTPSPSNPIEPIFYGNKTRNLFDKTQLSNNTHLSIFSGRPSGYVGRIATQNPIDVSNINSVILTYSLGTSFPENFMYSTFSKGVLIERVAGKVSGDTIDVSNADELYIGIYVGGENITTDNVLWIMFNTGSTALPYEPYGYKIPISLNQQSIILDESLKAIGNYKDTLDLSTGLLTRRVKELVLTGEENWRLINRLASVGGQFFNLSIATQERTEFRNMLCSHYVVANPYDRLTAGCLLANYSQGIDVRINDPSTDGNINAFRSYLAQQYANGTPITIWYALAEPTTETISVPSGLTGTIEGVGIQNGTPTLDMPIMPVGKGKRTENIAPPLTEWIGGYIATNGYIAGPSNIYIEKASGYIPIKGGVPYTFSRDNGFPRGSAAAWRAIGWYDLDKTFISRNAYNTVDSLSVEAPQNAAYCRLSFRTYGEKTNPMFNAGSTALPYEPYGYKLNILSGGAATPVYLGEVETTRRVKKLVLDGTENWKESSDTNIYIALSPNRGVAWTRVISTHFTSSQIQTNGGLLWFVNANVDFDTVEECKTYLAQQYSAGTPVTVWYVLATPTTGIVNEPLMRIGDYADSVDFSQAGVQIPTLKRPNTTVIDITTSLPPSEVYAKYRGSKTQKYDLFLAANGDSFEAKNGQSLYIGDDT